MQQQRRLRTCLVLTISGEGEFGHRCFLHRRCLIHLEIFNLLFTEGTREINVPCELPALLRSVHLLLALLLVA